MPAHAPHRHRPPLLAPARLRLSCLAACTLLAAAGAAIAAPAREPDAAAACVAAIERRAEALVEPARSGDGAALGAMRAELERAAALIGEQYLGGTRDEAQARRRLEQARAAQDAWTEPQREAMYGSCTAQASAELASANALQRYVIRRVAARRMDRMLQRGPATAASAPLAAQAASGPR